MYELPEHADFYADTFFFYLDDDSFTYETLDYMLRKAMFMLTETAIEDRMLIHPMHTKIKFNRLEGYHRPAATVMLMIYAEPVTAPLNHLKLDV